MNASNLIQLKQFCETYDIDELTAYGLISNYQLEASVANKDVVIQGLAVFADQDYIFAYADRILSLKEKGLITAHECNSLLVKLLQVCFWFYKPTAYELSERYNLDDDILA